LTVLTCQSANVHRPGTEDYSQAEAVVDPVSIEKSSYGDVQRSGDEGEATVENAEDVDAAAGTGSGFHPFFYAAKARANATEEDVNEGVDEDNDQDDDELNHMVEDVVGEIMMADELEGRSAQSAVWKSPYVPEYMQGRLNQLGGFSMPLQSYPDFSLPLGPPPRPVRPTPYDPPHGYYSPYAPHAIDVCPPCPCLYDDEVYDEDHEEDYDEDHEEDYDYDEEDYDENEDEDDVTVPYGFVYDPTVRYEGLRRSRRSVGGDDDDYWNSLVGESKFLAKNNVGYRIKNDLRKRLEDESYYPLHYGHIYTGSLSGKDVHDRPFGYDADFDLYKDAHAFKLKPHGPRLGKKWIAHGYPIYGYSLYKLKKHVKGTKMELVHHQIKKVDNVWLEPGVYRFVAILESPKKGSLLLENLKSGHRFIIAGILKDKKKLSKFQAVYAYKDPNAKYVPVMTHGSMAYFVRATPLTGANHDLLHHGYSDFKHSVSPGSFHHHGIINKHNVSKGKKELKLHKPDPRHYGRRH